MKFSQMAIVLLSILYLQSKPKRFKYVPQKWCKRSPRTCLFNTHIHQTGRFSLKIRDFLSRKSRAKYRARIAAIQRVGRSADSLIIPPFLLLGHLPTHSKRLLWRRWGSAARAAGTKMFDGHETSSSSRGKNIQTFNAIIVSRHLDLIPSQQSVNLARTVTSGPNRR